MTDQLELFLTEFEKLPSGATGYYPGTAGEISPEILERHAAWLKRDPRVAGIEPKYAGGELIQLWVERE